MTLLQPGQTERILLRAPERVDLEDLVALWADPQVTAHIGGPRTPADVVAHFSALMEDPYGFAAKKREWWWCVIERQSARLAGLGSLVTRAVAGFEEVAPEQIVIIGRSAFLEQSGYGIPRLFGDLELHGPVGFLLHERCPVPGVFMHPADAARDGRVDKEWVELQTRYGNVSMQLSGQESIKQGHARVPDGCWYPETRDQEK